MLPHHSDNRDCRSFSSKGATPNRQQRIYNTPRSSTGSCLPAKPSSGGTVSGHPGYTPSLTQDMPGGTVATSSAAGMAHIAFRFPDFVEFIYHAGTVAFSKPFYESLYPTLLDKMQALFRCLGVRGGAPSNTAWRRR